MTELYRGKLPQLENREFDVAYITPEILLAPEIRSGSGGLGVVAGSFMNELELRYNKHRTKAVAVAFYCSHGYQTQVVRRGNGDGGYMDVTYENDPQPEFTEDTGKRIKLIIAGRECTVAIRQPRDRARNHTAIILLDTDIPENEPDFRMITRVLYGEHHATAHFTESHEPWHNISWLRVMQAAVLGIGAYEVFKALNITTKLTHLNESHALLYLIRELGEYMKEGKSFEAALELVRARSRFTNHTILSSANRWYAKSMVLDVGGHYPGFNHEVLHRVHERDQHSLSMTDAALYLVGPGHANGVSVDHARIANRLWPGYDIMPVTNGVLPEMFQHPEFALLDKPSQIPDLKLHLQNEIYDTLRERLRLASWTSDVDRQHVLDSVFIAWARRCQEYKRPGLMWHGAELPLVKTLLEWRWISVAWGGFVHPDDHDMKKDWNKYFQRFRDFKNVMPVFNYRVDLMRDLKGAAQIWLNTPQYGKEACGTSWMSAMLNCALVVSTPDGAVPEAKHVVVFGSDEEGEWHTQYQRDAKELWQTLVPNIGALRDNNPVILDFLFNAKLEAEEQFSAERMVRDYITKLYP